MITKYIIHAILVLASSGWKAGVVFIIIKGFKTNLTNNMMSLNIAYDCINFEI